MSLLTHIEGAHARVLSPRGGCHICPRKKIDFVPPTLINGPVLFVGEAPGTTEAERGVPFTGSGGELLREVAQAAGVPGPWSFTNAVHCRPPNNEAPGPKEIECCLAQFTLTELRDYPVVVLVGAAPLQALFPGANAVHFRGNVAWHPDFPGQRFYAMWHPSAVLRRPSLKDEYTTQMQRLARIVAGEPAPSWHLVRGVEAVPTMQKLIESPLLSFDFETSRLESWAEGGRIKSVAATCDGKTVVVASEGDTAFPAILRMIAEYCAKPEKSIVGAHIGFDVGWLEQEFGIRCAATLVYETGTLYYEAKQYKQPSLKELASRELDGYRYLVHRPDLCKDEDLLLRYNAEDVVLSLMLQRKAMQVLRPKTRDLTVRVLGPADVMLQRMTVHGLYLRPEYRAQKLAEYHTKRRTIIDAWRAADPYFVPDKMESGNGLQHYLFEHLRVPIIAMAEKGDTPSTDKSSAKEWVRQGFKVVQHLLDLREVDKILSTYLTAYDNHVWPDQRIRSSYSLAWTDTGRSSSRNPNLQNIPRLKEIRDLFGVPTGSVMIESDLSQIEFRVMVCLAKDANGIAGYNAGIDAHTITARNIVGRPQVTKAERTDAKAVNFGSLYGGSPYMLQRYALDTYGVEWSIEDATRFQAAFMATYPGIPLFHTSSRERLIKNRGWFESVVGHVYHYGDWDADDQKVRDHVYRSALNSEAQGPAGHLMFYILVLARRMLDARGFGSVAFVNTVHDSVLTEVPNPAWVPDVIATINEAAQAAREWIRDWFVVPLIVDHKVGESWGSLEDYKG